MYVLVRLLLNKYTCVVDYYCKKGDNFCFSALAQIDIRYVLQNVNNQKYTIMTYGQV